MKGYQTKCELLVKRGMLVQKHFYVMRATALPFGKTSITIGFICKATHFRFRCLSLLAKGGMGREDIFHTSRPEGGLYWGYFVLCSCRILSFVTAKAEHRSISYEISHAIDAK